VDHAVWRNSHQIHDDRPGTLAHLGRSAESLGRQMQGQVVISWFIFVGSLSLAGFNVAMRDRDRRFCF